MVLVIGYWYNWLMHPVDASDRNRLFTVSFPEEAYVWRNHSVFLNDSMP